MPRSFGGGQLPISAFFGSASSTKRTSKTGNPRLTPKRNHTSSADKESSERPNKKSKQNENLTPSRRHSKRKVGDKGEGGSGSRMRKGTRVSADVILDDGSDEEDQPSKTAPLCDVLDDTRTNTALGREAIDDPRPNSPRPFVDDICGLGYSSLTPERSSRHHGSRAFDSLPSPPLTVPQARHRAAYDDHEDELIEQISGGLESLPVTTIACDVQQLPPSTTGGARIAGEGLHAAPSLHDSPELMLPPPLPLRIPNQSASSLVTAPLYSDKWVPSSQTQEQELTIPDDDVETSPSSNYPLSSPKSPYEVIPTSQSQERELEMPPFSDGRISGTPAMIPYRTEAAEDESHRRIPSPDIVESSQSQFEAELTPEWADTLAERKAEIERPAKSVPRSQTPSPPLAAISQDYEAHDEYSPDSAPSLSYSNLRVSPPPIPSQTSESSGSYDSQPHLKTPTQLRRFRDMFEGRDEQGNYLADAQHARVDRSPSPFIDMPSHPGSHSDEHVVVHERVSPPPIPIDDGSYSSSYGYSSSEGYPTPVRMFMEMFSSDSE